MLDESVEFQPTFSFSFKKGEVPASFEDEWLNLAIQSLDSWFKDQKNMPLVDSSEESTATNISRKNLNLPLKKFLLPNKLENDDEKIKIFKKIQNGEAQYSFANSELDRSINVVYIKKTGKLSRIELSDNQYRPTLENADFNNLAQRDMVIDFSSDGLINNINDRRVLKIFEGKKIQTYGIGYDYNRYGSGSSVKAEAVEKLDTDGWAKLSRPRDVGKIPTSIIPQKFSPVKGLYQTLKFDSSLLGIQASKFSR